MSARPAFVIVGANLAGGAAATTLRSAGFDGRVVLIGDERHPPYERPPLSKEYLRGEVPAQDAMLHPRSWYDANDVELRLAVPVARVDPAAGSVLLEDGERIPFDRLLLATGGRNRRPDIAGTDLEGVFDLRTVDDADRIRKEAVPGRTAVVIGAGFIGCEVAASLRTLGLEIEVVEIFEVPLQRALGREVGSVYEGIHRDHGVRFHLGQVAERIDGDGRVEAVTTDRGTRIVCDLVVIGIGIQPNVELLEGSGIAVDDGVLVDQRCRTSVEGIYAAGDVANHDHPLFGRRLRVEHYDNALKQGAAAARSMMGMDEPFDDPHWFWSDQYGHNLQSIGVIDEWDDLAVRGSMEDRSFVAFYLRDGMVRAAVGVDRGKDVRRSAGLIRARRRVDRGLLVDEDVDLKKLGQSLQEAEPA